MRTRWLIAMLLGPLLLAACGREAGPAATRGTTLDVAATTPPGAPAERHWQWFVTNVRSWAPEYRIALVPRSDANGPASLADGRPGIVHASLAEAAALVPELALLAQQRVSFSPPQIFKLSEVQKTHALLDQGLVSGKLVMHP